MEFTIRLNNPRRNIFVMCDMDGSKILTVNCLDNDSDETIDWETLSHDEQVGILDRCDELYLSIKEDLSFLEFDIDFNNDSY